MTDGGLVLDDPNWESQASTLIRLATFVQGKRSECGNLSSSHQFVRRTKSTTRKWRQVRDASVRGTNRLHDSLQSEWSEIRAESGVRVVPSPRILGGGAGGYGETTRVRMSVYRYFLMGGCLGFFSLSLTVGLMGLSHPPVWVGNSALQLGLLLIFKRQRLANR